MRNLSKNQIVRNVQMRREGLAMAYARENKRPFVECVILESEDNEYLRDFFNVLEKHIQRIRRASSIEYEREARKIHEQVQRFALKRAELVERLNAAGLKINENILGPVYDLGDFGPSLEYQRYEFNYTDVFGGLRIEKQMLLDPNDTTFKDRYEAEASQRQEKVDRIKKLKSKLRAKTVVGRIGAESRDAYKDELSTLRDEISHLQLDLKALERYERDYRVYSSMSAGTKRMILQYYEITEAIKKGVDAIKKCHERFERSKPPLTSLSVMDNAFGRMEDNGMIEEDVERVMELLDDVAHKRRLGLYDRKKKVSVYNREIPQTFLTDIYGFDEEKEQAQTRNVPQERAEFLIK